MNKYSLEVMENYPYEKDFSAIIIAVAHDKFREIKDSFWMNIIEKEVIVFDIKGILSRKIDCLRI